MCRISCLVIALCILQIICVPCALSIGIPALSVSMFENLKISLGKTLNVDENADKKRLQALRWGAHWSKHPASPAPSHAAASTATPVEYEWGSYRPGIYFGMKQITQMTPDTPTPGTADGSVSSSKGSVPVSAVTGFMWGTQQARGKVQLRHNTEGGKMAQVSGVYVVCEICCMKMCACGRC